MYIDIHVHVYLINYMYHTHITCTCIRYMYRLHSCLQIHLNTLSFLCLTFFWPFFFPIKNKFKPKNKKSISIKCTNRVYRVLRTISVNKSESKGLMWWNV